MAAKVADPEATLPLAAKVAAELLQLIKTAPMVQQTLAAVVAVAGLRQQLFLAPAAPAAPV